MDLDPCSLTCGLGIHLLLETTLLSILETLESLFFESSVLASGGIISRML
jgi:hypothetical protein